MDATVLSPAFGHIYCTKCTVSGSKTYVCTILDFFASAPTVPGAFFWRFRLFLGESGYFWESQVIFVRVRLFLGESCYYWESQVIFGRFRLFLGESGYFWESQVIFGRVRLFLGDSGYFWEIQVIIGRVYYGLAVETYNPLTHMLEVGC